jgi:hypothetical protein
MYRIHGYQRGELVPRIESGFPQIPAEEQDGVRALWARLLSEGGPVAGYHTIIDRWGGRHRVLSVGDVIVDAGAVVGVRGMVTDLTEPVDYSARQAAAKAVADSAAHRAVIEQAKGILMGRHGVSADAAFNALSAHSQDSNRRVADLAQDLVDAVTGRNGGEAAPRRGPGPVDALLHHPADRKPTPGRQPPGSPSRQA